MLRNFNLHVSDDDDIDSAIFNDTIKAMGLYQHVSFTTHKLGNTLDLVINKIQGNISVMTSALGPYLTDHWAMVSTLNIKKSQPRYDCREVRKIHKVSTKDWIDEFNVENIDLNTNLDQAVENFGIELRQTLDQLALVKIALSHLSL